MGERFGSGCGGGASKGRNRRENFAAVRSAMLKRKLGSGGEGRVSRGFNSVCGGEGIDDGSGGGGAVDGGALFRENAEVLF